MANDGISENIEEYLEVLYRNGSNKEQISTTTLSKELGIAPGSVTQMLKKLEKLIGILKSISSNQIFFAQSSHSANSVFSPLIILVYRTFASFLPQFEHNIINQPP